MGPRREDGTEAVHIWVLDGIPVDCRALHRAGDSIYWHFLAVIIVANKGYVLEVEPRIAFPDVPYPDLVVPCSGCLAKDFSFMVECFV